MFVGREAGEAYEMTRNLHHLRSVGFIKAETEADRLPLDQWQLPNVLDICRAHRSKVNIDEIPKSRPFEDGSGDIRIRLLASVLRIADACDVHCSRSPETVFEIHKEFIPRVSKEHWRKHFRMAHVRFNWDKSCIDIPINLPENDLEQTEQRRMASLIKTELTAELRSVENIFEEYGINLFHADIIDYVKGEYIDFSHTDEKDTLGWAISPFAKKSIAQALDVLLFQPMSSQEEVDHCFVEIPVIKELMQEIEKSDFKNNYLFCSHPRTGKTSMLAYLSAKASEKGFTVYWFSRQMNIPKISEFIHRLSVMTSVDEGTIVVFDNIHEDKQILSLISDLRKQHPTVVIWCASRISEFANIRAQWAEMGESFFEKEMPGYLDSTSIKLFLDKYSELIDEETERLILKKQNVTAYYLVDVYRQLKRNSLSDTGLLPKEVVAQISLDVREDNKKTFGSLDDMERMALKVVSFLKMIPRTLLENILLKIDSVKGAGIVDSLLTRRIVFLSKSLAPTYRKVEVETINIFDSFKEFVIEQLFELETNKMIPSLLISEARDCTDEIPHALLSLMNMYDALNDVQKAETKNIIFAKRDNPFVMNIASKLASRDTEYLALAKDAYDSFPEIESGILAGFGYAFDKAKDYLQSITYYVKALEFVPNNAIWLHNLAHSYDEINDIVSAVAYMERAVSLNKKYLDCLGVIYSKAGMDNDAFECYQQKLADDPRHSKTWNNIGNIYGKREDYDKQRECYEKALEIKPEFIWSLKGLARYYFHQKNYQKSAEYSLRGIAQDEKDGECWSLLGRAQFELGNYTEAKEALEKTIELNWAMCREYEYMGHIYGEMGDHENEIYYYKKTIEYHPEHESAYINLGLTYVGLHDFSLAQTYFLKFIELDSSEESDNYSYARKQLIFLNSMIKLETRSLTEEEQNELDGNVLNSLAYELILMERFGDADELLNAGLKKAPDFSYLYASKGMNYLRQGQVQSGHELYLQAISMSPDDINLKQKYHYEYGRALRIDAQFDKALQELESALHSEAKYVPRADIQVEILKAQQDDTTNNPVSPI
jgi:superkiller protein 3